jgi:hypothetical protein
MTPGSEILRVALLVDSFVQPAWVRRLVDEIQASDVARVALVVRRAAGVPPESGQRASGDADRTALLYRLYMRLDAWAFPARPDPFQPCDLSGSLAGIPVIDVAPGTTALGGELEAADVDRLLDYRLDVALCLGFGRLRGRALEIARHGVWAYHHGGDAVNRGGPPGFWEVMDRHATTGAVLQMLLPAPDGERVLYRSHSAAHHLSVSQNRLSYYWKSSTFVMRKLRELHRDGAAALARGGGPHLSAYTRRLHRPPTNVTMARLLSRLARRYIASHLRARVQYQQWTLAYRRAPSATVGDMPDLVLHGFRILEPPADRFWADPFVAYADGRHYVLFEDYGYAPRRGRISVLELGADGTPSAAPVPVLERPYHLSYPFLFTWRGERYMIPESGANSTVDVYRATRFPYEWAPETTLFAGRHLVDVTLQEIDGRWWMFANAPATPEVKYESWAWDELHLFYADSPLGPWHPHPRNPVVSDVRHARPAGRLFQHGGAWYRPAQDCGGSYGRRLAIQRIVRLDVSDYEEVPATTLTSEWQPGLDGIHTINAAAGLTVIDVRRRRWKTRPLRRRDTRPGHRESAVATALGASRAPHSSAQPAR